VGKARPRRVEVFWLSPTQLCFKSELTELADFNIRYAIVASDPTYQPNGVDTVRVKRCIISPSTGFAITKHNVDVDVAGTNDWIFRSDRAAVHFSGFDPIAVGKVSGNYPLPVPSSSGTPLSFFTIWCHEYWMGCGVVAPHQVYETSGVGVPMRPMFASAINPSEYYWWQDGSLGTYGTCASVNVADF
jgi:hypothetical protein